MQKEKTEIDQDRVFKYLDELRESGVVNMLGAIPYIETKFRVSREEAKAWLLEWIETFAVA